MLIGNSGVWGLKKNFALLELLERLQYSHERATLFYTADLLEKERQVNLDFILCATILIFLLLPYPKTVHSISCFPEAAY